MKKMERAIQGKVGIYALANEKHTLLYIGASINPEQRFIRHKYAKPWVVHLHILEFVDDNLAAEKEKEWIKKLLDKGYIIENQEKGWNYISKNIGKPLSNETRQKIRNTLRSLPRKPLTQETKDRIRESLSGRKLSDDHKQKISEGLLRRKNAR